VRGRFTCDSLLQQHLQAYLQISPQKMRGLVHNEERVKPRAAPAASSMLSVRRLALSSLSVVAITNLLIHYLSLVCAKVNDGRHGVQCFTSSWPRSSNSSFSMHSISYYLMLRHSEPRRLRCLAPPLSRVERQIAMRFPLPYLKS
jgi:hypothetical protein